jgi:beta-glucanase (GH16 family)
MDWKEDNIKIFIDDYKIYSATKSDFTGVSENPFNNNFFFLFNVAVGGEWPGNPDPTTVFPQRMVIDYVRVFQ